MFKKTLLHIKSECFCW